MEKINGAIILIRLNKVIILLLKTDDVGVKVLSLYNLINDQNTT